MQAGKPAFMTVLSLSIACLIKPLPLEAQTFQITGLLRLTNNEATVTFAAPVGRAYQIETATNLSDWHALFTFPTNATTSLTHTDSAAPFLALRYYRAVQLTGTNLASGDHLITTNGDAILQPRNHATFVLQWAGKMVYFDPVSAATYTGLPKADLILITHSHNDHFNTGTIDSVRSSVCSLIVPQAVYNSLTTAQKSIATILTNYTSTNVLGLSVDAVPAYGPNHTKGDGNGYVLGLGGKRIYVSGDTGDQAELRTIPDIDVAFVCMNQPYSMTVSAATNFVRTMRPKVVYPYHYRDANGVATNAVAFKQWLGTDLGIEVRLRKWY